MKEQVLTEFLKAGDVGTHVPAKLSLVCAKFSFVERKTAKKIYFIPNCDCLKKSMCLLIFVSQFFAQIGFDCIFIPAKQNPFRKSDY